MIQDPTDRYIATISAHCAVEGKDILEIGCGKGRITRDLARHAKQVVATDPDGAALEVARKSIAAGNVEFIRAPTGVPDLPPQTFDIVIYTLSFHHVPEQDMEASLQGAAGLLRPGGVIVILEPGDTGSFTETKERFGAGSGDETSAKEAAIRAMNSLDGWQVGETVNFRTFFQFEDEEDFLNSMLPDHRQQPDSFIGEVREFLRQYRTDDGILLDADRRLNVLRRVSGC